MNQQSSENEVTENLNNLSLSSNETETTKPKRGRPSNAPKTSSGYNLKQLEYNKQWYKNNATEICKKRKEDQQKMKDAYELIKELVIQYKIEFPNEVKERVKKIICI